jgi:hypothetical protein
MTGLSPLNDFAHEFDIAPEKIMPGVSIWNGYTQKKKTAQ